MGIISTGVDTILQQVDDALADIQSTQDADHLAIQQLLQICGAFTPNGVQQLEATFQAILAGVNDANTKLDTLLARPAFDPDLVVSRAVFIQFRQALAQQLADLRAEVKATVDLRPVLRLLNEINEKVS
jgi:hypothetical protein